MPVETSYSELRGNLATYLDRIAQDSEVVVVKRRNAPDVAMLPASELAGLAETAHLLRSPANAKRLNRALQRAERGAGKPSSVEALLRELGLASARS